MKIRWTRSSARFRITPAELESLKQGETVAETLTLAGQEGWRSRIAPGSAATSVVLQGSVLTVHLSGEDAARLALPEEEGVYFTQESAAFRYSIEKDFPCAHPRPAEAQEPQTATFAPPEGFEARKQG